MKRYGQNKLTPHNKKVRTSLGSNNLTFNHIYTILVKKDPKSTELEDDLHNNKKIMSKVTFLQTTHYLGDHAQWPHPMH